MLAYLLPYLAPFIVDVVSVVDEEPAVVGAVDEAKNGAALIAEYHDAELAVLAHYLVDDVAVDRRQIEIVEAFLLLLYAELHLVGVVEEEDGAEQGALAHALGADEVDVAVEHHLGIADMCAID